METIALAAIFLIISFLWYRNKNSRRNKLLTQFPSEKSIPFLKHGLYFFNKSPIEAFKTIEKFVEKFGTTWKLDIPFERTCVAIQDPIAIKEILSNQTLIVKSNDYDMLSNWLGKGILTSGGSKWRERRRLINPAFQIGVLEQFIEIMDKQGKIFVEKMNKFQGQDVDIFSNISLYTLDVICGKLFD